MYARSEAADLTLPRVSSEALVWASVSYLKNRARDVSFESCREDGTSAHQMPSSQYFRTIAQDL